VGGARDGGRGIIGMSIGYIIPATVADIGHLLNKIPKKNNLGIERYFRIFKKREESICYSR
jgi:hypothetical protein